MKLGSDIDLLANASEEQIDEVLKKYIVSKNVKADTAIRWALQRATDDKSREILRRKFSSLAK